MTKHILIINGHPDPSPERLSAALAEACAKGAAAGGHQVERIDVGWLQFPLIRSTADFMEGELAPDIRRAQEAVRRAEHLVIIHPLWLGTAPALMKGFFEQVFRYGFALSSPGEGIKGLLAGRSARIIVTMGMPAAAFRLLFGAHGVKSFEGGILWIAGIKPVRHTFLGGIGPKADKKIRGWLAAVEEMGRKAQ